MNEFISMGGFGAFVWGAMAVVLFFVVLEPVLLMFQRKSILKDIKRANRLQQRQQER